MIRILLLADTHLGFDQPAHPRVARRRRGPDFFANFDRALAPAMRGEVDLVVHGGDLLYRSRVPSGLVHRAMEPLAEVADRGVPVFLVPGNHERSRIPLSLRGAHPLVHVFDRPKTFVWMIGTAVVALAGFPFARQIRDRFSSLLEETTYRTVPADVRLLCLHQTVEGARVGPAGYTFRGGPDVVRGTDIPNDVVAVLAGHIHRGQVLRHDLRGRKLAAPVVYPGSIERTAFAERDEPKGYLLLDLDAVGQDKAQLAQLKFVPLPARPMVRLSLLCDEANVEGAIATLGQQLDTTNPEAVVLVVLEGPGAEHVRQALPATRLRALAPATMNINLACPRTASP